MFCGYIIPVVLVMTFDEYDVIDPKTDHLNISIRNACQISLLILYSRGSVAVVKDLGLKQSKIGSTFKPDQSLLYYLGPTFSLKEQSNQIRIYFNLTSAVPSKNAVSAKTL